MGHAAGAVGPSVSWKTAALAMAPLSAFLGLAGGEVRHHRCRLALFHWSGGSPWLAEQMSAMIIPNNLP
eukprot:16451867-Heterocapsa_arctica.AAC.3